VQFGCGFSAPQGWINFDASPTLRFERIPWLGKLYTRNTQRFPAAVRWGDITRGLPLAPGSCLGIYASHVLEHLSREDCAKALRRTWEYLAPGGRFRLVVPDLEALAQEYLASRGVEAAGRFMEKSHLGQTRRARGWRGLLEGWLGNSRHLWMWDEKAMKVALEAAGFRRIRRAQFHDSEDPRFQEVEEESRFQDCLAMEAQKEN